MEMSLNNLAGTLFMLQIEYIMSTLEGVQYSKGISLSTVGDTMVNVGDVMSISGNVQFIEVFYNEINSFHL